MIGETGPTEERVHPVIPRAPKNFVSLFNGFRIARTTEAAFCGKIPRQQREPFRDQPGGGGLVREIGAFPAFRPDLCDVVRRWVREVHGIIARVVGGPSFKVIAGVNIGSQSHLFDVVEARDGGGLLLGLRQGGQQHARQDGDDGNDDEQLD